MKVSCRFKVRPWNQSGKYLKLNLYTAECSGKSYAWNIIIKLACSWLATDNGRQSEESVSVYPPSVYGVCLACKTRGDIGKLTGR